MLYKYEIICGTNKMVSMKMVIKTKAETTQETVEAEGKISIGAIKQIAAAVGAVGVIIGAVLTVDNRYAKPEDVENAKIGLERSINDLHKDILEYEQLRIELGNSVRANKILLDKNKRDLKEVQDRLRETSRPLRSLILSPASTSSIPNVETEEATPSRSNDEDNVFK